MHRCKLRLFSTEIVLDVGPTARDSSAALTKIVRLASNHRSPARLLAFARYLPSLKTRSTGDWLESEKMLTSLG